MTSDTEGVGSRSSQITETEDVGSRSSQVTETEGVGSRSSQVAETEGVGSRSSRITAALICTLFGVMALAWIIATPPSGGPDEPNHVTRSAALVRGQLDGEPSELTRQPAFELPAWVGAPDPGCFAQQPFTPATCATSQPRPGGEEVLIETRSADYPIWGHLLPGLGTFLPSNMAGWAARGLDALPAVLLLGLAFVVRARRGWLAAGGALLAITPMAWFSVAVVNPSGLVVAGGIALWVGLGALRDATMLHRWLTAAAWAALVLPRRDGLIWAVLILSIAVVADQVGFRDTWRRLGVGPQILVVGSTLATMAWASRSDTASASALLLVPVVPFVVAGARRLWLSRWLVGVMRRSAAAVVTVIVGLVVSFLIMDRRPTGYDGNVLLIVIGRTGLHLRETIGVLGWLDTPLPETMVMLWVLGLGVLVGAALLADARPLLWGAAATLAAGIAASWVLEMGQGDPTGTYWQGRYYLPLLAGIPILLSGQHDTKGVRPLPFQVAVLARLGRVTLLIALVVLNVALAAAMRRWGVGIAGSLSPFAWNTYNAPIPPFLILALHAAASVALWLQVPKAIPKTNA